MNKLSILGCFALAGFTAASLAQSNQYEENKEPEVRASKTKCHDETAQQDEQECLFENWYVTGAIGFASGSLSSGDIQGAASSLGFDVFDIDVDDSRMALKLAVGVSITERISAELGYVDLGEVQAAFSTNTDFPDRFFELTNTIHPTSISGFTLSGVYQFLRHEDWFLQARLGLLLWDGNYDSIDVFANRPVTNNSDNSGTDLYFGIGANYQLDQDFQLIVEWERYTIDSEKNDLLSLGLTYHF